MPEELKPYRSKLLPVKTKLRKFTKMTGPNDGTRSMLQSVVVDQVLLALKDWIKARAGGLLIGDLAISYYVKPFATEDIELLFLDADDFPVAAQGFTKVSQHKVLHTRTNVEVRFRTPHILTVPMPVAEQVYETCTKVNGIRVASASGLVALKLFDDTWQAKAHVVALLNSGQGISLDEFPIGADQLQKLDALREMAREELERELTDPVHMEKRAYREAQKRRRKGK